LVNWTCLTQVQFFVALIIAASDRQYREKEVRLTKALKIYTKPLNAMSNEELDDVLAAVEIQLKRGGTVILGGEGCAFCGKRLGKPAGEYTTLAKGQKGKPGVMIIHACDKCREESTRAFKQRGIK
jgi:hypothetical protein